MHIKTKTFQNFNEVLPLTSFHFVFQKKVFSLATCYMCESPILSRKNSCFFILIDKYDNFF